MFAEAGVTPTLRWRPMWLSCRGATHPMSLSVCRVVGRVLTLTSATAGIGLSGEGANIYAVIPGLDPRTHSSAVQVSLRGRRGPICGVAAVGMAWHGSSGSEPEDDAEWEVGCAFCGGRG